MSVEPTDPPRYRCRWCKRVTYNTDDVEQEYCPCCGSADGLLPKDCEHLNVNAMIEALCRQVDQSMPSARVFDGGPPESGRLR